MNTLILFMVRSFEWWFSCWVWRFYIVFYKNIQKILSFAKQKGFTQTIKRQSGFLILLLLLNCCDLFSFKISMLWFGFSHTIFVFWLALFIAINQEFLDWDISKKQVYSNLFYQSATCSIHMLWFWMCFMDKIKNSLKTWFNAKLRSQM